MNRLTLLKRFKTKIRFLTQIKILLINQTTQDNEDEEKKNPWFWHVASFFEL